MWLISRLVDTFHTLPVSGIAINSQVFMTLPRSAGLIFINVLILALSLITLLLTLNIALGMLNRMSPQLSVFVIGFLVTLSIVVLVFAAMMSLAAPFTEHLFSTIFDLLANIINELPAPQF